MKDQSDGVVWQTLDRFLTGELSVPELEQWLYSTVDLERVVGPSSHQELIAFDFRRPHAIQDLTSLVHSIYERGRPGLLACDCARRVAQGLLDGSVDFILGVRLLARLHADGHSWVPIMFVGVASELDEVPGNDQWAMWDPAALQARLDEGRRMIEESRQGVISAARELISS